MYLQFFGLNEAPFSITPDPAFVYLSAAHRDALAHLLYGVGQGGAGGFVQLTGEVGTGKTTLCRCLLEQVPDDAQLALILNPMMTPRELLATICEELGIETGGLEHSSKLLVDRLNEYLLSQHALDRRVVIVIDEAQNLSPEALEQVRLLTNLETAKHKLLQMVLLGQPELRELLQRQDLRQLAQRITARYHLAPLGQRECYAYVAHRMKVAGAVRNPFRRGALRALYHRSAGVPRLINIIADRALAGAFARESEQVSARLVHEAADEVQPSESRVRTNRWPWVIATASTGVLLAVTVAMWGLPAIEKLQGPTAPGKPEVLTRPAAPELTGTTFPILDARSEVAVGGVGPPQTTDGIQQNSSPVPDQKWFEEQHLRAWQYLADLWQADGRADVIRSACNGTMGTGYACLRDSGSWARVKQLGLPVVLVLQEGSQPRHLLLLGLTEDGLLVGNRRDPVELERSFVDERWLGEYLVAWPQAPDWPSHIRRGESGAAVDIVMEMAALADPAWRGDGVFDASFESWLMAFQRRNGLKADGIVGPNTLLYLMAPTVTQPRLLVLQDASS